MFINWENLNQTWDSLNLLWEEVILLEEVKKIIRGGGGYGHKEYVDNNPWKQLNKELGRNKTKKVIKLYCKVNNIEFDESREVDVNSMKISVNEFERFVSDAISVKILS